MMNERMARIIGQSCDRGSVSPGVYRKSLIDACAELYRQLIAQEERVRSMQQQEEQEWDLR